MGKDRKRKGTFDFRSVWSLVKRTMKVAVSGLICLVVCQLILIEISQIIISEPDRKYSRFDSMHHQTVVVKTKLSSLDKNLVQNKDCFCYFSEDE